LIPKLQNRIMYWIQLFKNPTGTKFCGTSGKYLAETGTRKAWYHHTTPCSAKSGTFDFWS